MRKELGFIVPLFWLSSLPASADQLAVDWIDRITHEVASQEEEHVHNLADVKLFLGEYYVFNDNLFLSEEKTQDHAAVTFGRVRADYADQSFSAVADLLVNYDYYLRTEEARADEERFFGRVRYDRDGLVLGLAQIFRRETDPADVVFNQRERRIVSETLPLAGIDLTPTIALEASGSIQLVRFEGSTLDSTENNNYRAQLTALGRVSESVQLLAEAGYLGIFYQQPDTPDVNGFYVRGGIRGELTSTLEVRAALGVTHASAAGGETATTPDVELAVKYEAMENLVAYVDYTRRIAFAGAADPFQTVDRLAAMVEYRIWTPLLLRGRAEFGHVDPTIREARTFYSGLLGGTYAVSDYLDLDGGVLYRAGDGNEGGNFNNIVVYLGLALNF